MQPVDGHLAEGAGSPSHMEVHGETTADFIRRNRDERFLDVVASSGPHGRTAFRLTPSEPGLESRDSQCPVLPRPSDGSTVPELNGDWVRLLL